MRFKLKRKTFYFLLPVDDFISLQIKIKENNKTHPKGKFNLKFDYACYFLHQFYYHMATGKKDEYGYVRLCSTILVDIHKEYNVYRDFLEAKDFINYKPTWSTAKSECIPYKVPFFYKKRSFAKYIPEDYIFRKNIKKMEEGNSKNASKTCSHLIKWLDADYINIEYDSSLEFIRNLKKKDSSKFMRRHLTEIIHRGLWSFRRKGRDNRLHSELTRLPKDLRPFLRFKNDKLLASVDIKSSQPYILSGILNLVFLKKDTKKVMECINMVKEVKVRNRIRSIISLMLEKNLEGHDIVEIQEFINLITDGDIYVHIGNQFSESFLRDVQTPIGIIDKFYEKELGYKVTKHFTNLRDYCKKVMLEYLYCSPKLNEKRYKEVRRILPNIINELVDALKQGEKEDFSLFLQNVEAHLILDDVTKKIAEVNPHIPQFTIHDSIATTEEHVDFVQQSLETGLESFFEVKPKLVIEYWSGHLANAA